MRTIRTQSCQSVADGSGCSRDRRLPNDGCGDRRQCLRSRWFSCCRPTALEIRLTFVSVANKHSPGYGTRRCTMRTDGRVVVGDKDPLALRDDAIEIGNCRNTLWVN